MDIEKGKTSALPVERAWDHHLFECCGGCDKFGWKICCIGYWFPCWLWGTSAHRMRASRSVGAQVALYLLLFWLFAIVYQILLTIAQPASVSATTTYSSDTSTQSTTTATGNPTVAIIAYIVLLIADVLAIVGIVIGFQRRKETRAALNIPYDATSSCSSPCCDCCTWWCCTGCALCQEARTLRKNDCVDGVCQAPYVDYRALAKEGKTMSSPSTNPSKQAMDKEACAV